MKPLRNSRTKDSAAAAKSAGAFFRFAPQWAACLLLIAAGTLRADFSYEETSQVTGGSTTVTTHRLKGNRMADLTGRRITVIDLDHDLITEIDLSKKTYSQTSFEQMKKAIKAAASFQTSVDATGQTKAVGVLKSKEVVVTMTTGGLEITADAWMATFPGYGDVAQFDRNLGEKLGFLFGSGLWRVAMEKPEAWQGLEEAAKQINKLPGVPLEYAIKMGASGEQRQTDPASSGKITGALDKLGLHKNEPADSAAGAPAGLIEVRTRLDNFNGGPADASKFDVPAGFKKVDSPFEK